MKGPTCPRCGTVHFTTQPCPADKAKVGKKAGLEPEGQPVASQDPPLKLAGGDPESPPGDTPKESMTASELASKGGKARAARMTPEQRSAAARKAANARWAKE